MFIKIRQMQRTGALKLELKNNLEISEGNERLRYFNFLINLLEYAYKYTINGQNLKRESANCK